MPTTQKKNASFSKAEQAAMRERALELKAEAKNEKNRAAGERALLAKVAEMPAADKKLAEQIHALVTKNAPGLLPKTWYGMPAYANKAGKVVFFFQGAAKFEARYATLGFNDPAKLDDGTMWPTSFAITKLTTAEEQKIAQLLKKAVS